MGRLTATPRCRVCDKPDPGHGFSVNEKGELVCGEDGKCHTFVRVGRLADYLGVSYKTVGRWADKGKLEVRYSSGGKHRRVRQRV